MVKEFRYHNKFTSIRWWTIKQKNKTQALYIVPRVWKILEEFPFIFALSWQIICNKQKVLLFCVSIFIKFLSRNILPMQFVFTKRDLYAIYCSQWQTKMQFTKLEMKSNALFIYLFIILCSIFIIFAAICVFFLFWSPSVFVYPEIFPQAKISK